MKIIDCLNQFAKVLLLGVVMVVPAVGFIYGTFNYTLTLTVFLYGIILERIWFSLFTTKEGKTQKSTTNDWTLILVTYIYLVFVGSLFYDLVQGSHRFSWLGTATGVLLMLISYILRNWSVYHLAEQWASHLEITDNVGRYLVRSGPYAYMRHPIYAAAIVEFTGMQFLFGGNHSLPVLIGLGIPSVILRSQYEEKIARTIFGDDYLKYKEETGCFLPYLKSITGFKTDEGESY